MRTQRKLLLEYRVRRLSSLTQGRALSVQHALSIPAEVAVLQPSGGALCNRRSKTPCPPPLLPNSRLPTPSLLSRSLAPPALPPSAPSFASAPLPRCACESLVGGANVKSARNRPHVPRERRQALYRTHVQCPTARTLRGRAGPGSCRAAQTACRSTPSKAGQMSAYARATRVLYL
jgi:hypothetical protein